MYQRAQREYVPGNVKRFRPQGGRVEAKGGVSFRIFFQCDVANGDKAVSLVISQRLSFLYILIVSTKILL